MYFVQHEALALRHTVSFSLSQTNYLFVLSKFVKRYLGTLVKQKTYVPMMIKIYIIFFSLAMLKVELFPYSRHFSVFSQLTDIK